jgi:hippurate hydrolase
VVIFQPAEEGGGGGREMVEDRLMERFGIEEVYGLHNDPRLEVGAFQLRAGPMLASSDKFTIAVTGRGGHAAMPHLCSDTVLAASQIVVALQTVVARQVDPLAAAVLSVTSVHSDSETFNVLPARVVLKGTVRTLAPEVRDLVEQRVAEVVAATARAAGVEARLDYSREYPVTVNHADQTAFAARVAEDVAGAGRVAEAAPVMGAEDFSYMLEARPGAFVFMGNGGGPALHHPEYDFNDEAIPVGCSYWVRLVETAMPLA